MKRPYFGYILFILLRYGFAHCQASGMATSLEWQVAFNKNSPCAFQHSAIHFHGVEKEKKVLVFVLVIGKERHDEAHSECCVCPPTLILCQHNKVHLLSRPVYFPE